MHRVARTAAKTSYWHTTEGKKRSLFFIVGGSSAIMIGQYVPQTFMLDSYQNILQHYSKAQATPVPDIIKKRFDECLDMMNFDKIQKSLFKPFTITGFNLYTIGSSKTRFGSRIGIPISFNYEKNSDISKSNILAKGNPIDWGSEPGEQLADSLILTENAQKYALLREIITAYSFKRHWDTVNLGWSIFVVYIISSQANYRIGLFDKPKATRFIFYGLASLFTMGLYFLTKDSIHVYYDRKIDTKIAEMGTELVQGGYDYYDKSIKRNIALRSLLGREGETQFTRAGNDTWFIRQKGIPLTERRMFFENILNGSDTDAEE